MRALARAPARPTPRAAAPPPPRRAKPATGAPRKPAGPGAKPPPPRKGVKEGGAGASVVRQKPDPVKKPQPPPSAATVDIDKEAHKLFDEVVITVRSGKGGRGEITRPGAGRTVQNFKFKRDGRSTKTLFLEAGPPARGADGGAVLLRADPGTKDLLHLHARERYAAKDGANGDPLRGSAAPRGGGAARALAAADAPPPRAPPLVLPVPLGTVVKTKAGALLGELLTPGQTLCVARGGLGGAGVVAPSRRRRAAAADDDDIVDDDNWKADADGGEGETVKLALTLRVVADVGIVGLPNAGKSSLLAALTAARPEVAAYPFTTLMPNLGVLAQGRDGSENDADDADPWAAPPPPTLADLPGLIEGAHVGRGLGRMFLRHLRRARVVLHVVDGSAADPVADYASVRRELALYNPDYVQRTHVVALNKVDVGAVEGAGGEDAPPANPFAATAAAIAAGDHSAGPPPVAVVVTSAATGVGVADLAAALSSAVEKEGGATPTSAPLRGAISRPRDRAARMARARAERREAPLDW